MKILIADDDASVRRVVRRVVRAEFGATVCEVEDGLGALEKLHGETFDLVILDLQMKVIDGIETLEAIRRTEALTALPVVVITGAVDAKRAQQLRDLKVLGVIVKPFSAGMLHERLLPIITHLTPAKVVEPRSTKLNVRATSRILLVGPEDDCRGCFASVFDQVCEVTAYESAAAALRETLTHPPDAVFLTGVDPMLPPHFFARKIPRQTNTTTRVYLVGLPDVRTSPESPFDGVLPKLEQPRALLKELRRLMTDTGLAFVLLHHGSDVVEAMFDSAASAVASTVDTRVEVHSAAPPWGSNDDRAIEASAGVCVEDLSWTVKLLVTHGYALRHAKRSNGSAGDPPSDSDLIEATSAFAQDLANHLLRPLDEYGLKARLHEASGRATQRYGSLAQPPSQRTHTRWLTDGANAFAAAVLITSETTN